MKFLTSAKFNRAKEYILNHGRDLEQQLFRFHFEGGSKHILISVLSQYQGEDGGFSNMGEGVPQFSNGMDTSMAFQYLSEVGATSNDSIIQKGIKYIIETYDHTLKCWHPRHNEKVAGWRHNPGAELLGYLYEYRDLVAPDFLESVTETAIQSIRNTQKPYDQYYFLDELCILRLAMRIDEPYKTEILNRIRNEIYEIIETNQDKWATTYCCKPFFFAHSPESPLNEIINYHVIRSLENEVITQADEGNFVLNWNVEDEISIKIWKSIWTMDALRALHHHKMIEI